MEKHNEVITDNQYGQFYKITRNTIMRFIDSVEFEEEHAHRGNEIN